MNEHEQKPGGGVIHDGRARGNVCMGWLRSIPGTLWLVWLVYVLTVSGRVGNQDAEVTLGMSRLMLRGEFKFQQKISGAVRADRSSWTSPYGVGHSLYLIPYVEVGRGLATLVSRFPAAMWEDFVVSFANVPVIGALMAYLMAAWRRAGASEGRVALGVLAFGFGTMLWPYSKWPFSDSLMALAVFAAWYHWTQESGRLGALAVGTWLGLALVSRRQADSVVPLLLVLAAVDGWRRKDVGKIGWVVLAIVPWVGLRLWYNAVRFGSPFMERQHGLVGVGEVLKSEPASRFQDVLFSASYGYVPYNLLPALVLLLGAVGLWRRRREDLFVSMVMLAGGIGFLSLMRFGSGVSFGSRYLLYTVAFAGLAWPYVPRPKLAWHGLVWVPVVVWSVWLMAGGVAMDPLPVYYRVRELKGTSVQWRGLFGEWGRVLGMREGPDLPALEADEVWRHDAFRRPDFWWCHLAARMRGSGVGSDGRTGSAEPGVGP